LTGMVHNIYRAVTTMKEKMLWMCSLKKSVEYGNIKWKRSICKTSEDGQS
jgi:hypothetical protein